jgi:hypothetical protein
VAAMDSSIKSPCKGLEHDGCALAYMTGREPAYDTAALAAVIVVRLR